LAFLAAVDVRGSVDFSISSTHDIHPISPII
jgi:hypothetical protein